MRFDLTDEQELMRDTARRFLEKAAPVAELRKPGEAMDVRAREIWRKGCELGWAGLAAPESVGGFVLSGALAQDLAVIAEEIGRLVAPGFLVPTAVGLQALALSDEHLEALGPAMVAGEALLAWAFGEPGNGWEPAGFQTRIEAAGEALILDGAKAYVEGGADAGAFVVTARFGAGLSQVLVLADHPGVTVAPARSLDLGRRFAEVRFNAVRLPASALLGSLGAAETQVERQLQLALLLQCAETNGAVARAYEFTVEYMGERHAFGRPIVSYQALKHRLADMLLWLHSCMATTDAALAAYDAAAPEAGRLARIAKTYVATKSTQIMGDLVQLTGGIAVTWEHDMHLYERRVAVNRAVFGAPEQHRAQVHRMIAA